MMNAVRSFNLPMTTPSPFTRSGMRWPRPLAALAGVADIALGRRSAESILKCCCAVLVGTMLSNVRTASAGDLPLPVAELSRTEPVDFASEIVPLLKQNCLACHNTQTPEGGLVLESLEQLRAGGDSGPGVVAGDVENSLVFARASGSEEPLMPPMDNQVGAESLNPQQLALLKLWIEQGAEGTEAAEMPLEFQPIPESIRTVNALDVSPDGRYLAISRGNRIHLYDTHGFAEVAQLVDESLGLGPVAGLDLVQSLKFSPDGRRIASGDFRTVRIWQRITIPFAPTDSPLLTAGGAIAIKPDQSAAALVNAIGDLEIWDLGNGVRQHVWGGLSDRIEELVWAAAADRIYAVDQTGRLWGWDPTTGAPLGSIDVGGPLHSLTCSADGAHVAAIDHARKIHRFALNDQDGLAAVSAATDGLADATAILFAQQPAPLLIVATESAGVTLRALADDQVIRTIDHGSPVHALALSPDGTRLATGGRDGASKVWNMADGALVATLQGSPQTQLRLAAANRDTTRATAVVAHLNARGKALQERLDKETAVLDKITEEQTKAQETLATQEQTLTTAIAEVSATEMKIAQAEQQAETARKEMEAAQQRMAEALALQEQAAKELEAKKQAVVAAEKAKQEMTTAIANRQSTLDAAAAAKQQAAAAIPAHQRVTARAQQRLEQLQQQLAHQQQQLSLPDDLVVDVAFSPDGVRVATAHAGGEARLFRAADGLPLGLYEFPVTPAVPSPAVAFVNDVLIGSSPGQRPQLWRPEMSWELERTIGAVDAPEILSDRVTAIDFHPDGLTLAAGSGPPSRSGQVKMFAVDSGALLRDFGDVHSDTVLGLAFSPAGELLASSAADKTIRLLDVASGSVVRSMEGHTHHVLGIDWQHDGLTLASAGADQTVKLWDPETGQQRRTISGFGTEATALTFVAETNQLAAASAAGKVQISNAADGKTVKTFDAAGDFLYCVAVTPKGTHVFSGGHSGTVKVWNIESGELIAELK